MNWNRNKNETHFHVRIGFYSSSNESFDSYLGNYEVLSYKDWAQESKANRSSGDKKIRLPLILPSFCNEFFVL